MLIVAEIILPDTLASITLTFVLFVSGSKIGYPKIYIQFTVIIENILISFTNKLLTNTKLIYFSFSHT